MSKVTIDRDLLERIRELMHIIAQGDQAAWDSYESVRASAAKQGEGVKDE